MSCNHPIGDIVTLCASCMIDKNREAVKDAIVRAEAAEAECKRLREMRVSIPLTHAEVEALRPERLSAIGEMRGWNVGFPAGFSAGARAFAEWMLNQGWVIDYGSAHGRENVGDACDEFLASQRETNSNNKEGE